MVAFSGFFRGTRGTHAHGRLGGSVTNGVSGFSARFAKARVAVLGSGCWHPSSFVSRTILASRKRGDARFGGPRTVNHENGQADVVVGVFVVHDAASDTRGKKEVSGWDRFPGDLEVLGTRETRHAGDLTSSGDAPREVHGLVAQHLELHGVVVQAVLSQNLHGPDHRLARRLVHVE